MSIGIPAITIDGGGRGTGGHALDEAFDTTNSWQGTQRAVLLASRWRNSSAGEPGIREPHPAAES